MNQHGGLRFHPAGPAQQVARRHALDHHRGRDAVVDVVGQGQRAPCWHDAGIGIRRRRRPGRRPSGRPRFPRRRRRWLRRSPPLRRRAGRGSLDRVPALAAVDVAVVDPGGRLADQHLSRTGRGRSTSSRRSTSGPPVSWKRMHRVIAIPPGSGTVGTLFPRSAARNPHRPALFPEPRMPGTMAASENGPGESWISGSATTRRQSSTGSARRSSPSTMPTGWSATATASSARLLRRDRGGWLARDRAAGGLWRGRARRDRGGADDGDDRGVGGAMAAASSVHMNIFGPRAIVAHGSEDQKRRWLPPLIEGRYKMCFAVTEPNAGLDTTRITTRAERDGAGYAVRGQKSGPRPPRFPTRSCYSPAPRRAATTRRPRGSASSSPISTATPRGFARSRRWGARRSTPTRSGSTACGSPKPTGSARKARVPLHTRKPQPGAHPGRGGSRRDRSRRPSKGGGYAKERVVFGRPIGANQGIQHPLAASWSALEAATSPR